MLEIYVDDIQDLDEGLRSHYVQDGDKYRLNADFKGAGLEKVDGLKSTLARKKEEINTLKDRVSALQKYETLEDVEGFDPANISELMAKANSAGDPEAIDRLTAKHDKAINVMKLENEQLKLDGDKTKADLTKQIINGHVKTAAIEAGVLAASVDDVVQLNSRKFQLIENKVVVVDDDGDPLSMSPTDYFKTEYKESKPHFYGATGSGGSGSQGSSGDAGGSTKKRSEMSPQEKSDYIGKHGQEAYLTLE